MEVRLRRADGSYRWHLKRAVPLRDAEGRVSGWIGTNTDIEEQKNTAQHHAMLNRNQSSAPLASAAQTWCGIAWAKLRNRMSLAASARSAHTRAVVSTTMATTPATLPASSTIGE
ncbi:PAS domain-containing protein [Massilia yuzhufengensis]|uniref:PAS domain-containing protein n=1 Tax=Massilia yuzhufengensis TaxID=1164594 RepID=UPI001E4C0426|nr:PAS domain-containing protein [Massilia yuzhufengensis]